MKDYLVEYYAETARNVMLVIVAAAIFGGGIGYVIASRSTPPAIACDDCAPLVKADPRPYKVRP